MTKAAELAKWGEGNTIEEIFK